MSLLQSINILKLCLVIVNMSSSQKTNNQKCHHMPLVENFKVEKVEGIWYPFLIGNEEESQRKCVVYKLTANRTTNSTTLIAKLMWRIGDKHQFVELTSKQVKNTSEFISNWHHMVAASWMIGSDYASYLAWYVCIPAEKDKGIIFLSTKARNPDEVTKQKALKTLSEVGLKFPASYFHTVDRSTCNSSNEILKTGNKYGHI